MSLTDEQIVSNNRFSDNIFCRAAARLLAGLVPGRDSTVVKGVPTWGRPRSSSYWNPRVVSNVGQVGQAPVKLADKNPGRIELWVRNDVTNTGNLNLTTPSGQFFWPLAPGEGVVIDTCYDEIWAVFDVGAGGNVRVFENLETP